MPKKQKTNTRGPSRNKRASCSRRRTRRTRRSRGGMALDGAPVSYRLAGSWPSRMSLGQGEDYFKYHVGQHGGKNRRHRGGMGYDANMSGAPAKYNYMLPESLRMAAHVGGIDKAIADVRGLKDPGQMGGRRSRRRRGSKRSSSKRSGSKRSGSKRSGSKRSGSKRRGGALKCWSRRKSNRNRRTRRRGGSMEYAPFPNKGMLLDTSREYAQAGLNPQWKTDVAFDLAEVRKTQ